ncbi:MAG: CHRD domain-containing protein [Dokdonella sp.]
MVIAFVALASSNADAQTLFFARLNQVQEVPATASSATGAGRVTLNAAETQISVELRFAGLGSNASAAHIHATAGLGSSAGVLFGLAPPAATSGTVPVATFAVTPAQVADLRAHLWYFNVHTSNFPGGEIRGQIIDTKSLQVTLSGAQEVPANASTALGTGIATLNAAQTQLSLTMGFTGLSSSATAGHVHGPAIAGVNAPVLFPLSPAAAAAGGAPEASFAVTAAQVADFKSELYYFNLHCASFPGGEIRAQIVGPVFADSFD